MSNFNEQFYIFNRVATSTVPLSIRSILTVEYYVEDKKFIDVYSNFMAKIFEKEGIKTYSQFCELIKEFDTENIIIFESYLTLSKEKSEMRRKLYAIDMTLNNFMVNLDEANKTENGIEFSYIKKGTKDNEKKNDKSSILHYLNAPMENENKNLILKNLDEPEEKDLKSKEYYEKLSIYMCQSGYVIIDVNNLEFYVPSYTSNTNYKIWFDNGKQDFKCGCKSYFYSSEKNPDFKCKHLKEFIHCYENFE
jgi:hypothetical protein